jgi:hypothetical protein
MLPHVHVSLLYSVPGASAWDDCHDFIVISRHLDGYIPEALSWISDMTCRLHLRER